MIRSIARPLIIGIVAGATLSLPLAQMAIAGHAYGGDVHWSDGNQPRAFVTIEDYTPAGWPVLAATNEWATSPPVDMYYNFGSCPTNPGHCVDVRLANFTPSCNTLRGQATLVVSGGHLANSTKVRFNNECSGPSWTNRDRRAIACHELGHVLGLNHDFVAPFFSTCMDDGVNLVNLYEHPRPHDFDALLNIYDHNDP